MLKLRARGNYQNYDAHFVPVAPDDPNNPNTDVYYPCAPNQKHCYTEVVVFDKVQCLPRYLVTLQPALPKSPSTSTLSEIDKATANSEQKPVLFKYSSTENSLKATTPCQDKNGLSPGSNYKFV
jgi:hypothetical protein